MRAVARSAVRLGTGPMAHDSPRSSAATPLHISTDGAVDLWRTGSLSGESDGVRTLTAAAAAALHATFTARTPPAGGAGAPAVAGSTAATPLRNHQSVGATERSPLLSGGGGGGGAGHGHGLESTRSGGSGGGVLGGTASLGSEGHATASRTTPLFRSPATVVAVAPTPDDDDMPLDASVLDAAARTAEEPDGGDGDTRSSNALLLDPNPAAATAALLLKRQLTTEHSSATTGLGMTACNLFQDVLTNGVVMMPLVFALSGWGGGVLILVVVGCACDFTLLLVRDALLHHSLTSYYEMVHRALGLPGYLLASAMSFVFNWGGYVGTILILSTLLPPLMHQIGLVPAVAVNPLVPADSHIPWIATPFAAKLLAAVLCAPLAFLESISRFAYLALVSTGGLLLLVAVVVGRFFAGGYAATLHDRALAADAASATAPIILPGDDTHAAAAGLAAAAADPVLSFVRGHVWLAVGAAAYQFTAHDVFGHVLHSLRDPTPSRVGVVAHVAMAGFGVCGVATGLCGFFMFLDATPANVLDAFPAADWLSTGVRVAVVLNCLVAVPYTLFVSRASILSVVQLRWPDTLTKQLGDGTDNRATRRRTYRLATVVLLVAGWAVTECVTDLGDVFPLVGAVSGVTLSLLFPPICYLRLEPFAPLWKRVACYAVVLVGIGSMAGCVVSIIFS